MFQYLQTYPDITIFALFAIVVSLHALFVRVQRIFVDIVAVYVSLGLVFGLPLVIPEVAAWLNIHDLFRTIAFVGLLVLFHVVLWRSAVARFSVRLHVADVVVSLFYRLSITGLVFSTAVLSLNGLISFQFGPIALIAFGNLIAFGVWFIIPFFAAFAYRYYTRNGWLE